MPVICARQQAGDFVDGFLSYRLFIRRIAINTLHGHLPKGAMAAFSSILKSFCTLAAKPDQVGYLGDAVGDPG